MSDYTERQLEYINSVAGNAHMSAVEIIGELEAELAKYQWLPKDEMVYGEAEPKKEGE